MIRSVRNSTTTTASPSPFGTARGSFKKTPAVFALLAFSICAAGVADKPAKSVTTPGTAVLWSNPSDLADRDLFYGIGGKDHQPHAPFAFVSEDLDGTNPKFVVKDADGTKWKVKLGLEARSETVATRLVWAVGYFTNEDYFLPQIQVSGMPAKLHRGRKMVSADGAMHNVRMKRQSKDEKKVGEWAWKESVFTGSRELNGLRTLMALINNWDLKDVNNAIYHEGDRDLYMVSDLGACFGSSGRTWPRDSSKDNLEAYRASRFIRRETTQAVDFRTPARPNLIYLANPKEYVSRIRLEYIGHEIPRADAKWIGGLLSKLSPAQIRDAFRASGYSPEEIEAFSQLLKNRITQLTDL